MKAAVAAALIHFVWQGAAIGVLAWLGFVTSLSPRVRYFIGIAALAVMTAAPLVTGVANYKNVAVQDSPKIEAPAARSGGEVSSRGTLISGESGTADHEAWSVSPLENPRLTSAVLTLWLVGVAVLSLRLAVGWLGARRLTQRVTAAGADLQAAADRLIAALRIRAGVSIVESTLVKVPAVIGAFAPVVLLPAAAMSGLSMEQVEALLAHELAHVRRHDYLVNLLQSAVETLLFYHPAVWLVSRRVRHERELCCDDLALAVCGDRVAYASALADLESRRALPSPALAASGGSLLARVRRILGHDETSALAGRSKSVAGLAILAAIILLAGTQAARARGIPTVEELAKTISPGERIEFPATWPVKPSDLAEIAQAQGVQGVIDGVVGGVPGGVQGGVKGGVKGGVPAGAEGGLADGIKDAVAGGVQAAYPVQETVPVGPIQSDWNSHLLRAGDQLRIVVSSPIPQPEFSIRGYQVETDGTVRLPHLDQPVKVSGLTVAQVQEAVRKALIGSKQYSSPTVDVDLTFVFDKETQDALQQAVIGPFRVGDNIRVDVGDPRASDSFKLFATIPPDGLIAADARTPEVARLIANVKVAGETSVTIAEVIADRYRVKGLPVPTIDVTFDDRAPTNASRFARLDQAPPRAPADATVTVQGAVRRPGNIALRPDRLTLLDAIAAAGGLTLNAGRVIHRHGSESDVYSQHTLKNPNLALVKVSGGDTITVEVAPHFYVTGYVKNSSSEYNWEPGVTLGKAIAMAGGVSDQGAINRVAISRKDPATGKFVDVKLDKDRMSTPILGDDVIKVPKKRL